MAGPLFREPLSAVRTQVESLEMPSRRRVPGPRPKKSSQAVYKVSILSEAHFREWEIGG